MSDRDLKCIDCYEDQTNYGNYVDAMFVLDGDSLCQEHYHVRQWDREEESRKDKEEEGRRNG